MRFGTRSVGVVVALALFGSELVAQEMSAIEGTTALHRVDPFTGQSSLVGNVPLLSPSELSITALVRDLDSSLLAISTSQTILTFVLNEPSRVYRVNEATGASTLVMDLPPTYVVAATIHPVTGTLWILNATGPLTPFGPHYELMEFDMSQPLAAPLFHGELPLSAGFFGGLEFDPSGTLLYSISTKTSTLWAIDPTAPQGGVTAPVGMLQHNVAEGVSLGRLNGGPLLGYGRGTGEVLSIDESSAQSTLLATVSSPLFGAIAGGGCDSAAPQYGAGCAGSGGFVPDLRLDGCPDPGLVVQLVLSEGLGGSTALLFLSGASAIVPIGSGCDFLLQPPIPAPVVLPLGGVAFGAGSSTVPIPIPLGVSGVSANLQAFVLDPANSIGVAGSNGLRIEIN